MSKSVKTRATVTAERLTSKIPSSSTSNVPDKKKVEKTKTESLNVRKPVATPKKNDSKVLASSSTVEKPRKLPASTAMIKQKAGLSQRAIVSKTSATKISNPTTKLKTSSVIGQPPSSRRQPIRAVYAIPLPTTHISEKNVMNTIHNVTIASPPSKRKEYDVPVEDEEVMVTVQRQRTKTRTLEPDEILVLNKKQTTPSADEISKSIVSTAFVKDPIAFEINFEESAKKVPVINAANKTDVTSTVKDVSDEYEDDFDSYESDFESVSSSKSLTDNKSSEELTNLSAEEETDSEDRNDYDHAVKMGNNEDNVDSGLFEVKAVQQRTDSMIDNYSEVQNDSGFSYNTVSNDEVYHIPLVSTSSLTLKSNNHIKENTSKRLLRGIEIMKKISLDTMTYSIFEQKPIAYEYYMKIYGHSNTSQSSTQTFDEKIDQECQTASISQCTMWTQWPPHYTVKEIDSSRYQQERLGFGNVDVIEKNNDEDTTLDSSLQKINKLSANTMVPSHFETTSSRPIDYEQLNLFLMKMNITMSNINSIISSSTKHLSSSNVPGSQGTYHLTRLFEGILKDTKVRYLYTNYAHLNIVYVIHCGLTNEDNYYVSKWNVLDTNRPLNILASWGTIECMEVHSNVPDVVFAGLSDGSISIWNVTEPKYWHRRFENETVLVASQLVAPHLIGRNCVDIDRVVAIKTMIRSQTDDILINNYNPAQIYSLHESGLLTIWTILQMHNSFDTEAADRLDHRSPWSTVKLVQSNIIDLNHQWTTMTIGNRSKSAFQKTRSYFESNLFSDSALQELNNISSYRSTTTVDDLVPLRCTDLEVIENRYYVATNKKYLIAGTESLHTDSLRRIVIINDDGRFVNATRLKSMFNGDTLLVGLSNGSVKALRGHNNQRQIPNERDQQGSNVVQSSGFSEPTDIISAKSCAIENIIKDERKTSIVDVERINGSQVNRMDCEVLKHSNDQILLHGLSLTETNVRWMEFSAVTNNLFVLCHRNLRVVNLENMIEVITDGSDTDRYHYSDAILARGFSNTEYLVMLRNNEVQVHVIKK